MRVLAIVCILIVIVWVMCGGILAFLGRMARQGLAAGSNEKVQAIRMRQEQWAGRVARVMYRRLWPVPVLALAGLIAIAASGHDV